VRNHPFAPADCANKSQFQINHETEANIIYGHLAGWDNSLCPEATHLIRKMLDSDESKQPSAKEALAHPMFWTKKKKIDLLIAVGNQPEFEYSLSKRSTALTAVETDLEASFSTIVNYATWNDPRYVLVRMVRMPAIYAEMTKKRKPYGTRSVVELVRFIRNSYAYVSKE
jgi:serine/threonine protein kinase